jgi:hypothetical protein
VWCTGSSFKSISPEHGFHAAADSTAEEGDEVTTALLGLLFLFFLSFGLFFLQFWGGVDGCVDLGLGGICVVSFCLYICRV